ncbi:MAG TPA: ElyC/SanA/YdcF family protein [Chitinophagaceae bacterium]|jgi:SanA protein|nr:ElyC/SanA/YdcF family protein [Chitinophagaceae bacterium]
MRWIKRLFWAGTLLLFAVLVAVYASHRAVEEEARGRLYDRAETVPFRKTGLLLGTAKRLTGGQANPYYTYRIEAAAALYRAGKIRYLIVSGDNGQKSYNEPGDMRADLMAAGVDSAAIYLDYAGFRTFDSMVRLKEIFGQDSVTVISQPFHNARAVYIARKEGISAIGFNARDPDQSFGWRVQLREKGARVKLFLDYMFGQEPKFGGPKVKVGK